MNFNGYYLTVFFNTYRKCFRCKYISLRRLNFSNNVFAVFNVLKGKFAPFSSVVTDFTALSAEKSDSPSANSPITAPARGSSDSPILIPSILPLIFSLLIFTVITSVIFTDRNRECFFCKNISCRGLNLGNNIFSVYYVLENKFAVFFSGNRCKSVFSCEIGFAVGEQSDNCSRLKVRSDSPTLTPSIFPFISLL